LKDSSRVCTSSTVISTSSTTITTPANIVAVSNSSISQCPSTSYDNIPLHSIVEDQIPETVSISDKLRFWVVKYNVFHNCCNSLLKLMKSENVPNDKRTLMKTPKTQNIVNMTNGSYIHLGIENMLLPILNKNNANIYIPNHVIKIGINIDGLLISRSSKSQLWPIFISVLNFKELINNVMAVGIYHGDKKLNSIEEFMNPFVLDLLSIMNSGLNVNGTLMKLEISNIICDAPAKRFLLNVKSHNAYFGCTSCIEEGTYVNHKVIFPGIDSTLRTDYSFRNRLNEDYHKGSSPLELLPIDIVDTICLDYMHNICLGVIKRLVEFVGKR